VAGVEDAYSLRPILKPWRRQVHYLAGHRDALRPGFAQGQGARTGVRPPLHTAGFEGGATPMSIKPRVGALILIVLGALFLLSNLGMLPRLGPLFAQWWPLILIVVGVSMLVRK
jgi:hypothetical protein